MQNQPVPWKGPDRRAEDRISKLARVTHNLLQSYVGSQYEYDGQGNTVIKRQRYNNDLKEAADLHFAYDEENRLISVAKSWYRTRMVAEYRYDAFNRRIGKRVTEQSWALGKSMVDDAPSETKTSSTWFVWDGDALVQEIDDKNTVTYLYEPESFVPVARIESKETDADYGAETVHIPAWRQANLPRRASDPCQHVQAWCTHNARERERGHNAHAQYREAAANHNARQDKLHYYQCDHLGTPLELVDDEGNVVWGARYKAWGRVERYDVREVEQPLRFQGQYWDAESGLHYNRHRYYDPDAARFITQDPIGLEGGYNFYQYGLNPVEWIDPLGEQGNPYRRNNGQFGKKPGRLANKASSGHGNCKLNPNKTTLYKLVNPDGTLSKWGITSEKKPENRYSQSSLGRRQFHAVATGPRAAILALERGLVETNAGLENLESWAGKHQGQKSPQQVMAEHKIASPCINFI